MKPEFEAIPLQKNDEKKRFEININNHFAFIDFKEKGSQIWLIHTEAAPELNGTGAATAVVEKTLQWIEEHHYTLFPYCPYVFAYIKKHPEWKRIVDPNFNAINEIP